MLSYKNKINSNLRKMNAEEFMAMSLSEDDDVSITDTMATRHTRKRKRQSHTCETTPTPSVHQLTTDDDISEISEDENEEGEDMGVAGDDMGVAGEDMGVAGDDMGVAEEDMGVAEEDMGVAGEDMGVAGDDMGVAEPRPHDITSWKEKEFLSHDGEDDDGGGDSDDSDGGDSDGGDSDGGDSDGGEKEQALKMGERLSGKIIKLVMVKKWVKHLEKTHSLHTLHRLGEALHCAILSTTLNEEEKEESRKPHPFIINDSTVFNYLVVSCFKHVPSCLAHHIPDTPTSLTKRPCLPSSQGVWPRVRRTVKQYLLDLLSLLKLLQEVAMQCAVLKQILKIAVYFICYPKLLKTLNKCLIDKWSTGENHVQVLAFLSLRRLVLFQPHPSLHTLLKKLYLAFVRNCKFTTASSQPTIRFMTNSLVELLALDPPTSYQHGFVYIRQLSIHLRTALTSGKKDAQKAVYNWQYVHCLNLWGHVLAHVSHSSLRPLVYPLVQTVLGTLQLQPSAKYHPLKLHLIKLLLHLSSSTTIYIPIAPLIVEMLEVHGSSVNSHLDTGKPPDLSVMLRASKQQLNTQAFHSALLNKAFELMLQYFADHAHFIGFPELAFPVVVRLRKVIKTSPYSWLRLHLKQLIEKVNQVSEDICKDRGAVSFSPKDSHLVISWESQRKGKENQLSCFWSTWNNVHQNADNAEAMTRVTGLRTKKAPPPHPKEVDDSDEVDRVENLQLSD